MPRAVLSEDNIHPAVRAKVAGYRADIVKEVQAAIAANEIEYKYLEYGSYFGQWRRRLALKMWTGWPSLPMVFVNGVLVGGASDLEAMLKRGELAARR
jgi:monothiol glutaredoxin